MDKVLLNSQGQVLINNNMAIKYNGRLPSEYQEVEWVESSGTQYINTNVPFPNGFRVQTNILILDKNGGNLSDIVGAHNSSSPYGRNTLGFIGNIGRVALGSDEVLADIYDDNLNYVQENIKFYIDAKAYNGDCSFQWGSTQIGSNSRSWNRTNNNLYIFAGNNGSSAYAFSKIRVYDMIISIPNGKIFNFIPCYRKSDGVIGLYDLCGTTCPLTNSPFYINAGIGSFTKGGDI